MTDDPGVMGNLPRSRPGRRSDKRKSATTEARPAASKARLSPGRARPAADARPTAPKAAPSDSEPRRGDPIADAVHIATRIAGAGIGVAAGIVRRLPRP
jgi:hypothetical protein